MHRHEVGSPQPQGSSLLPELCCLEPSSLNRPHPPHSWAHRIFTAWRLIRDAFAVRERLGDPRVVPGFRYPFCPGIPSSPTPGSSIIVSSSAAMSTRPSPRVDRLGTPKTPAIRFTRAMTFVASWFTHLLRSASLLAPCTDLTGYPASGAFTSGLSAGWSPFPLQDITTTATGLLCWRDSHPLEWQLASLHLLRSSGPFSNACRFRYQRYTPRKCATRVGHGNSELSSQLIVGNNFQSSFDPCQLPGCWQCPSRVKLRSLAARPACRFYPQEQTLPGDTLRSVSCQIRKSQSSFDHLIRKCDQVRRNFQTECSRCS